MREVKKSDRKIVDQEKEVICENKMIKVRKWYVWKWKGKKGRYERKNRKEEAKKESDVWEGQVRKRSEMWEDDRKGMEV